jgi:hypothetical protein
VTASQVADLTASTQGHHWRAPHTQSGRPRMCSSQQMLEKLADLTFKLANGLRLGLQLPEGS